MHGNSDIGSKQPRGRPRKYPIEQENLLKEIIKELREIKQILLAVRNNSAQFHVRGG